MKIQIIRGVFIVIALSAVAFMSDGFISNDYPITTAIDNVELDEQTLYIDGYSNLPDGAVVEISVKPGEMEPAGSAYTFDTQTATVTDSKWSTTHDAGGYPGRVVSVKFALTNMKGEQPDNVTKALGDEGQHIGNPDIYIGEDLHDGFYIYDYTEEFTIQE